MANQLTIRLQPKQSDLLRLWDQSPLTRIGFGGARGGAKSGGSRRCMLLRRLKYPKTTGLILRRTYPELYKSHILKLFEEYPETRHWWREQPKEITFPNGSRLFFGSAEHERDISNFHSAEFADILIDEAQEFSQNELEQLTGSCRCTSNAEITPKMIYTFMPGASESGVPPKGLSYLKRVFVDEILQSEEQKQGWGFVQAFSWDNIEWARKELARDGISEAMFYGEWTEAERRDYYLTRTEYGAVLQAISNHHLRDAWLYGKWDVFEGQYFPNFSYQEHTIDLSEVKIERWHRRWIAGDWGYDHPSCILLFAEDEHGVTTIYDELWGREIGETELGQRIGEMAARTSGGKFSQFFLSWDAFGKLNKTTKKSITQMIGEALPSSLPKPTPADSSPGSRISGWRLMHQMLDSHTFRITRNCEKLIECLPTLVRDLQRNPEDVLKVDYSENYIGDDAADACRYGLQNMLSQARVPLETQLEKLLTTIPDPHGKHMAHLTFAKRHGTARRSFALPR